MTEAEKKRMIELLIEQLYATGESEGIWFLFDKAKEDELTQLLKKYDPDNEHVKEILKYGDKGD